MTYQYDYAVIGGDMRQVYLVEELAHHTNRICHYALCATPDVPQDTQLDSPPESQLDSQQESRLDSPLESQLDSPLESQLDSPLESQLDSPLELQLDSPLESQLDSPLESQLDSPLESCLDTRHRSDTSFVTAAASLSEICSNSSCIIGPIPFSKNEIFLNQSVSGENLLINQLLSNLKSGQSFFAGCLPETFKSTAIEIGVQIHDLMENPSLSYFNSIATAEGAICEAIKLSPINLHKSSCAVLGYGKCGRTLSHYLKEMFCHTYVVARKEEDRAQAALTADRTGTLNDFEQCVGDFDFIFNTIPAAVVTSELLSKMKPSVTIIDIASNPGGVDFQAAKELGIHALLCPGLPGKYAPSSSAQAIKEIIEQILKE